MSEPSREEPDPALADLSGDALHAREPGGPPGEREAWAVLLSAAGLGPAGFGALLAAYGSGRAILEAARRRGAAVRFARIAAEAEGRPPFREAVGERIVAVTAELDERLAVLRGSGLEVVTLDDPGYPARLRAIELPPPVLLVRGDPRVLGDRHLVAVVGTRRPTEQGRLVAARIATVLTNLGAVVVSGLAVGIDGAAHAAVVAADAPTIGVLGSGHERLFPRAHRRLAAEVLAHGGVLVSEFWPEHPPSRRTFPQRNRVISGLSDATIVVEAGLRSGALITAKWALLQGRELFLVPGPIDEPRSAGCLAWLREFAGEARIVAALPELVADLGLTEDAAVRADSAGSTDADRSGLRRQPRRPGLDAILSELGPTARDVGGALVAGRGSLDELVEATGHEPATVLGAITLLELRGLVTTTYGRYRAAGQLAGAGVATVQGTAEPRVARPARAMLG